MTNLTQTGITGAITAIINNFPNLQNTINNLTNEQKAIVLKDLYSADVICARGLINNNLTDNDLNNIRASMVNACNFLNIDIRQFDSVLMSQPSSFSVMLACIEKPELIKYNLTKDEFITATNNINNSTFIEDSTPSKGNSYVNWDIGVGVFANYFVTSNTYLIGGISFFYDLAGSKGRKIKIDEDEPERIGKAFKLIQTSDLKQISEDTARYKMQYAIAPKIGIGIQCSKRFSIEVSAFDQITKIEYDCSSMYKLPMLDLCRKMVPDIIDIFPDRKQSNWVNRFGAELGIRLNIKNKLFTKLGTFYLFPRNIANKIKPFDFNLQSFGSSLTIGFTF